MKNFNKKILLAAIIISLITAYFTFLFLRNLQQSGTVISETKTILVASRDILPGEIITDSMLEEIDVNKDSYIEQGISNKNDLMNKSVREKIFKGETIPFERLVQEGETSLPFLIPEGKRAVSLAVDEFNGVADLIQPDDFVDVYVTVDEKAIDMNNQKIVYPQITTLLLQNIQVMAISKKVEKSEDSRTDVPSKYAVTLAVSAIDGEKLILAEEMGKIKLALRRVKDDSIYLTPGIIRQDLVTEKGKVVIY